MIQLETMSGELVLRLEDHDTLGEIAAHTTLTASQLRDLVGRIVNDHQPGSMAHDRPLGLAADEIREAMQDIPRGRPEHPDPRLGDDLTTNVLARLGKALDILDVIGERDDGRRDDD